jgi:hypothetical protein
MTAPADLVSQLAELEQTGPLVQLQRLLEFPAAAIDRVHVPSLVDP